VFAKQLWNAELRSPFRLMPGKAKGKHGRAPFVTVGDEMHEWVSTELADTLRQGEGTSLQPIRLYASTAGLKSQKTGYGLWEQSQKILDGRIDDPTTLVVIFAPTRMPTGKTRTPGAANPSLGLSPTMAFLRGEIAKAVTPAPRRRSGATTSTSGSRILALDLGAQMGCGLADREAWRRFPDELKGRECVLSFDSTKSFDLASMCLRFPPVEPASAPSSSGNSGCRAKPSSSARWPSKRRSINGRRRALVVDPWRRVRARLCGQGRARGLRRLSRHQDRLGQLERAGILQPHGRGRPARGSVSSRCGSAPSRSAQGTKEFERKVFGGEMDHGGNPVARWMIGHCNVRFDENMNYVPAKKRSEDSIDGIVAAVMAEAMAMAQKRHNQDWFSFEHASSAHHSSADLPPRLGEPISCRRAERRRRSDHGVHARLEAWNDLFGRHTRACRRRRGTAATSTAIYACVNLIAGAIMALPVNIYRVNIEDGERDRIFDDDLLWVFNEEMSPRWPASIGWEFLFKSLLFEGDAFAVIKRDRASRPIGLEPCIRCWCR
jgi:hypothetical protein